MSTAQSSWEEKNRLGEKAFQEGRLVDANRLFTEALQQAQQFGPNDLRLAPIYNNLALVSFVQNNFIASETLYEKSIAVMQAQGQENPLLLPVLDNLTSLYVRQWAFGKAIQTSWRACHIREKKFGPANLETAAGLNKLATLYLDSVRLLPQSPSDSLPAPESARENPAARNSGCELQDFNPSIEHAVTLADTTKLAIAESLFDRVLEVQAKAYGDENSRLVDVLQNLGEVRHAQGKIIAAEDAYIRSIAIVEKSFGPEDLKLAMPLQQLAELKTEDGSYSDAEILYQRALRIGESKLGSNDPTLGVVLTGYAALLEKMHRSGEGKALTDRATSLAAPRTLTNTTFTPAASVPYILRFEKLAYDQYTGVQQTCMLIRADGRFRTEQQQHERTGPATVPRMRMPDGMPDMSGMGQQEVLNDSSHSGSNSPKVFENSLDAKTVEQLKAILSAKEIRDIQGSYPSQKEATSPNNEAISVSILREDRVQNFAFPDNAARQHYEAELKPLFKWLNTAEKHKGPAVKGVMANNCSPDTPNAVPIQFSSSRANPSQKAGATVAAESAANQTSQYKDISQNKISTIKVDVNLVLVRVVVRDSQGRPLGTLRQQDFRLLDNGKPQTITKFSLEEPGARTEMNPKASNGSSSGSQSAATPAPVDRSVAYLFDDIHMNAANLRQVRDAADRHLSSLSPTVRAAIFTTSGQTSLDFTDDRTKLHEILFRIQPRQVASAGGNDCPDVDPYMADLIANKHDEDALGAATEDALVCAYGNNLRFAAAAEVMAKSTAQQQVASAEMQTRIILQSFETALRRLAATPGQHAIFLVSPGFIAPSHEQDFGQLIEQALHSDIIISTLDARGLYHVDSVAQPTTANLRYRRDSASANEEILRTLANATGGTSFQNSNDFAAGFTRVAQAPEYYYILGFSPQGEQLDGRFHNLTVTLNNGDKLTLQSRKGYYARKQ
jgi:VWFA-related protein